MVQRAMEPHTQLPDNGSNDCADVVRPAETRCCGDEHTSTGAERTQAGYPQIKLRYIMLLRTRAETGGSPL